MTSSLAPRKGQEARLEPLGGIRVLLADRGAEVRAIEGCETIEIIGPDSDVIDPHQDSSEIAGIMMEQRTRRLLIR
jgi:hypothetical protein